MKTRFNLSANGLALIKLAEAFRAKMYYCQAGLPTIGYGTVIDTAEEMYLMSATITEKQAEALLLKDCAHFVDTVNKYVQVFINQNMFDALVSLVYNIGAEAFRTSTLLRLINANSQNVEIARWFMVWNKVKDKKTGKYKISNGLTIRRGKEVQLFFMPCNIN